MAASVTASVGVGTSLVAATTVETASLAPTGSNKTIYALVGSGANTPSNPSAVKYASTAGVGGESLTLLDSVRTVNTNIKMSLWKLANPVAASGTIHATLAGLDDERWIIGVAVQDSAGTEGAIIFGTLNSSTAPTVTATTTSGNLVLDFLSLLNTGGGGPTITCDVSQASVKELESGTPPTGGTANISPYESAGVSSETAAGATTVMSWTISTISDWGLFAFQVNGATTAAVGSRRKKNTIHPGRHPDRFGRHLRTKRNNIVAVVTVSGTTATTLDGVTLAAQGTTTVVGSVGVTLEGVTIAATGSATQPQGSRRLKTPNHPGAGPYNFLRFKRSKRNTAVVIATDDGALAITLDGVTLAAQGTTTVVGALAQTLDGVTLAAQGTTTVVGSSAVTLAGATLAAQGTTTVTGSLAVTLDGVTLAASGAVGSDVDGSLAVTLAGVTLASQGTTSIVGAVAVTLDGVTLSSQGTTTIKGNLAVTLMGVTSDIYGYPGDPPVSAAYTVNWLSPSIRLGILLLIVWKG